MEQLIGTQVTEWRARIVPLVLGIALAGCAGDAPSSPSGHEGHGSGFRQAGEVAAARFPISVSPRSVRLTCALGGFCETPVALSASTDVSFDWSVEGDFTVNFANTNCDGTFDISNTGCVLAVVAFTTGDPGRRTGILTIESGGATKTVRLTARVQ